METHTKYSRMDEVKFGETAFNNFEVTWPAQADNITSYFLKAVFHKFYLVHSRILCLIMHLFPLLFIFSLVRIATQKCNGYLFENVLCPLKRYYAGHEWLRNIFRVLERKFFALHFRFYCQSYLSYCRNHHLVLEVYLRSQSR